MSGAASLAAAPPGARAALLFDLDGTLATTEHLHRAAYEVLLGEDGRSLDAATFAAHVRGRSGRDIAGFLFPAADAAGHERLIARKESLFRDLAAARGLTATPGVGALLGWARARGVGIGLVTNAPRANAMMVLDVLGIAASFDVIVSGDEMARRKPFPDPFLAGLRALGVDASRAMAVEDSPVGIASARAADLDVIAVASATIDASPVGDVAMHVDDLADPRVFTLLASRFALEP